MNFFFLTLLLLLLACSAHATTPLTKLPNGNSHKNDVAVELQGNRKATLSLERSQSGVDQYKGTDFGTDPNSEPDEGTDASTAAAADDDDDDDDAAAAADPIIEHPPSIRQNTIRRPSFPKSCPCKQIKARPGKCYYFINSLKPRNKYKCKSRTCVPRYVCIPRIVAKKIAKKFGKKLLMCIRRVTRKRIVPWIRKGRKGYCKSIRTRRRVFYVPYVRNSGRSL